jgi:hypothetical protein
MLVSLWLTMAAKMAEIMGLFGGGLIRCKGRVTRIFGAPRKYYRTVIFALHSKFRASNAHQIMLLLQFSIVKILVHHTGSLAVFFFLAWLDTLDCVFSDHFHPLVLPFFLLELLQPNSFHWKHDYGQ